LNLKTNDESAGAAGPPLQTDRPLFEKLPAYFRESPGSLEPIVTIGEELVEALRGHLERERARAEAGRWPLRAAPGGRDGEDPSSWDPAIEKEAGTVAGILRWLERSFGAEPQVWSGFEVTGCLPGFLEVRRSLVPAAVLAWERGDLTPFPAQFTIPGWLLPARVRVQAVLIRRRARKGAPVAGERIPGEVFWSSEAQEVRTGLAREETT